MPGEDVKGENMKSALLGILLLAALAPVAAAESSYCEQSCCLSNGGTWDYDYDYCDGADSEYYSCTGDCPSTTYGSSSSSSGPCCGSGFILASVGLAAMAVVGRKSSA